MADPEANGNQQQPEDPTAALRQELETVKGKNQEYERLLLDPQYLEYLAQGSRPQMIQQAQQVPQPQGQTVDFDAMSNKDLVEYLLLNMRGMINQAVTPVSQQTQFVETKRQVEEAAAKHPDFWEYKEAMIAEARKNPNLTAQDAYDLVKARAQRAPKKTPKPSETPTGGGGTKREPAKGFEAKFQEAWNQAGLGSTRG